MGNSQQEFMRNFKCVNYDSGFKIQKSYSVTFVFVI